MNIFVSSTVYDLLDLREELFNLFQGLNAQASFSEINESSFEVSQKQSSIEACCNLNNSDHL